MTNMEILEVESRILADINMVLLADEPIKCTEPDCREIHLSNSIEYGIDDQSLKVKFEWSHEKGRYIMFREDQNE